MLALVWTAMRLKARWFAGPALTGVVGEVVPAD